MKNKSLKFELKLSPELDPGRIILNLARRFKFRNIVLDDIDITEDSEGLKARISNLACGIDAEAILKEDATPQGYAAPLCLYAGPVVCFSGGERKIVRAELSAHIFQNASCRGRLVRKAERHRYTPKWWPFEDSY